MAVEGFDSQCQWGEEDSSIKNSSPTLLSFNCDKMNESDDDDDSSSYQSAELLDELFSHCSSAAISEKGIQEIIQRHKNSTPHHRRLFHAALSNEKVTEEIIRCLLEYFPAAANDADFFRGQMQLHYACNCKNVSIGIIRLLIDANPDAVRHQDRGGYMPLNNLCNNTELDEAAAIEILKLLLEKYPDSVRHKCSRSMNHLPIHFAVMAAKSPEFCSVLIEAYPGSERIPAISTGMLPFHIACVTSVATVEYLYNLYPDAIDKTASHAYPIHHAITSLTRMPENNQALQVDANEGLNIVKFLLDCDPRVKFQEVTPGESLLHFACRRDYDQTSTIVALGIIEAIYNAHPDFIRKVDNSGRLPLHKLCANSSQDNTTKMAILGLLLEKYPESTQRADNEGLLPIHIAAMKNSNEFCRVLIEACPGIEKIPQTSTGMLPFHYACMSNTVDTVEYLYKIYPDAINESMTLGMYPIHAAIHRLAKTEANPRAAVDMVKFLLDCDPRVKFQKLGGEAPTLPFACIHSNNIVNTGAAMDVIEAIFDADPEGIGHESLRRDDIVLQPLVRDFVDGQLAYYRQANDTRLMITPNDNGQLPLHTALQNNVRLGSIKLLVKGNILAVRYPDNSGALPLHVACMHHESTRVVHYLVGLDTTTLDVVDHDGNTALHYACDGAKYETIALLLDNYGAVSVSKRNAEGKLPIEILWEKEDEGEDEEEDSFFGYFEESAAQMECVFRLLRAYPEMMNHSSE